MSNTAFLFAGQGAQVVGMGKDFAGQFPAARACFDQANEVLGYDLASVCFNGPEAELTATGNAQPAIYTVSWIALQLLKERVPALKAQAVAGLSLGEFTALAASGVLRFEDGLRLVRQRGQHMQEACETTKGSMAAVMGLDEKAAEAVCREAGVQIANLNCPGQIVISGEASGIARACELAKAKGAKRALPLTVAGAYHSKLMAGARDKLRGAMGTIPWRAPLVPIISNVTAQPHGNLPQMQIKIIEQVTAPVRWEDSMRFLLANGFTQFIEFGPGTVLSGFMKRIDGNVRMLNVSDVASLEAAAKALQG